METTSDKRHRVALIAIASNETAYLAQFVFHHLRLGFAPIIIISNNSQDATAEMASHLAASLPDIHHMDGNPWRRIWKLNEFQLRAYQMGINLLDGMKFKPDYTMFLDIDEYWTPIGDYLDISEYINQHDAPDAFMFNWVLPDNDQAPFSHPFLENFIGVPHNHMKMLWKYRNPVKILNPHAVAADGMDREIVVSGLPLIERHATANTPKHPGNAMIVHQMFRSMPEYIAILTRGRPSLDVKFKTNRWGYRHVNRFHPKIPLTLSPNLVDIWQKDFLCWIDTHKVQELIRNGRKSVLLRALEGIKLYQSISSEERLMYEKAFLYVEIDEAKNEIEKLLQDLDRSMSH